MSTITPTAKQHPLINKGSMKSLYQEVIKCKMCPRLVDFREKIANESVSNITIGFIGVSQFQAMVIRMQNYY